MLTGMRFLAEGFWSIFANYRRARSRESISAQEGYIDTSIPDVPVVQEEMLEANTGHKTPKRFWRCNACDREGHVF